MTGVQTCALPIFPVTIGSCNLSWSATGTVTSIATTSPIPGGTITGTGTIGINNAAADGSTKGAASFTANDFDALSGNISIDYANGQTIVTGKQVHRMDFYRVLTGQLSTKKQA